LKQPGFQLSISDIGLNISGSYLAFKEGGNDIFEFRFLIVDFQSADVFMLTFYKEDYYV